MHHTNEKEIRVAVHKKLLNKYHSCPSTMVFDELGVSHGKNRIDIAILNGKFHGYEIKSSKDTLSRLSNQLEEYQKCFQKVTFVVAQNHLNNLLTTIPDWCGVIEVVKDASHAITFEIVKNAKTNPNINSFNVAHFLWKNEAIEILERLGVSKKDLRLNKLALYQLIANEISHDELTLKIKEQFFKRKNWKLAQQL